MLNVPLESSGGADLAVAHALRQRSRVARDLAERLDVGIEDRRHDEGVLGGHGDADVDARVQLELAVAVAAVRPRELLQRQRGGLDHEVVERRGGVVAGSRLELLAERDGLLHVDLEREHEVRRGRLGLGHPARDRLLQPREVLDRRSRRGPCRHRPSRRPSAPRASAPPRPASPRPPPARPRRPACRCPPRPRRRPSRSGRRGRMPVRSDSSTPSSRAMRRAIGEAFTRPLPSSGCGSGRSSVATGSGCLTRSFSSSAGSTLSSAPPPASCAGASSPPASSSSESAASSPPPASPPPPPSPIFAMVSPTGSVSPSWATIVRTPASSAS